MPDPLIPGTRERELHLADVDLHVVEAGEGPPVILAHGFPELSYSWRHQLPALAAAGYRAIAPDQRGYGRSSRPEEVEDYDIFHLTGDLVSVLDDLGEEKAVFVGHDWGSIVVWNLALLHPGRVAGVVGMSVPFLPRGPMSTVALFRSVMGDNFFYVLYFQEPAVADEELARDPETTMRRLLCGGSIRDGAVPDLTDMANDGRGFIERLSEPDGLPSWLSQAELDHYVEEFRRTGFTGGINWYRNFDRNWERTEHLAGKKVSAPSMFIGGARDPVLVMSPPAIQEGWLEDHRGDVIVADAGHWVQQEKPAEVNAAIVGFLRAVSR